jgi:hypothetical protein
MPGSATEFCAVPGLASLYPGYGQRVDPENVARLERSDSRDRGGLPSMPGIATEFCAVPGFASLYPGYGSAWIRRT